MLKTPILEYFIISLKCFLFSSFFFFNEDFVYNLEHCIAAREKHRFKQLLIMLQIKQFLVKFTDCFE